MISFAEPDPAWNRCYRIPAGGRRMEMDWEHIARAFEAAQAQLGWDAEVVLTPKEQNAVVLFPPEKAEYVGETTGEFYDLVEDEIGAERFMSIWIDFLTKEVPQDVLRRTPVLCRS